MNIKEIRKEFPFFTSKENKDVVYLDNSSTTQKPKVVLESIEDYYANHNANANRGSYSLAVRSSQIIEESREKVANFIGANSNSIVFTKGATESLNLVAYSYGLQNLKQNDEVLISVAEHHANLVNWQFICNFTGAKLVYFELDENLNFDLENYKSKLNSNTKIVSFTGASNVLSFDVPIKEMVDLAHKIGAITIVDAAQLVAHERINVHELNCDFLAFSAHKLYANQGVGVLYGKYELLEKLNPFLYGGDMIEYVGREVSTFAPVPQKFEAGTQNVEGILSLKIAIEFLEKIGFENIKKREESLVQYTLEKIRELDFIKLYYPKKNARGTNITFNVDGIHPHDVSQVLDFENIAIRTGHHCTQVLHKYLGLNSSCRVSIAFYNTVEEIDKLISGLKKVREIFYGN